jgi:septum formation protein
VIVFSVVYFLSTVLCAGLVILQKLSGNKLCIYIIWLSCKLSLVFARTALDSVASRDSSTWATYPFPQWKKPDIHAHNPLLPHRVQQRLCLSTDSPQRDTAFVQKVIHMSDPIILASGSATRAELLRNAGLVFDVQIARVDETAIRQALQAEQANPRDIADALAETKAQKIAAKNPASLVIGCDQVLALGGEIFAKPQNPDDALEQLQKLRGQTHLLLSAVVIYQGAKPIWRHVGVARLSMRDASDAYLADYIQRNWDSIRHAVGAYKLEEEGVRLFSRIDGDYFTILGLPLLELLSYLTIRGTLPA